ncbi:HHL050Wp [Eremothecium sinecaudum]|uniref:HHL050Wp n=1 Tax=Eremothecium sinecaudum TaxID=45286 RepID=A0A0X8HWF1_9SACH|nr:HHL050Wp [Eremothecium sinecaudum]AMD22720.1 HHL050Wp [Eremothecium sinecaudum]
MSIPTVVRVIRVKTQQVIVPEIPLVDGLPTRRWSMEIYMLDEHSNEVDADIFESCTYILHPSFSRPKRKISWPPFTLDEQGWGEFELKIICQFIHNGGKVMIPHTLLFSEDAYAVDFSIQVPCHIAEFRELLKKSGTVPELSSHEEESSAVRQKIPVLVKKIAAANEATVNDIVRTVLSYPGVKDALLKRRHRSQEFVMHLGQLPDDVLEAIDVILKRG